MSEALSAERDPPGALYLGDDRCRFCVWAPESAAVAVHVLHPRDRLYPLERRPRGYHEAVVEGVRPGARYLYRLESGEELPDPASRRQPDGVLGPSAVAAREFAWRDDRFQGVPIRDLVFYEVHVGAFTQEGTFEAVIPRLGPLRDLGVTALELMPVAQFPGDRNWGYDGVFPYAVQESYGGPEGMKRLVDACHREGIAVALDVVYNHIGPEGNRLDRYGPYFTDRYRTPWGSALNFDGPWSDEVRAFFLGSALYFLDELRIDVFRVDAIHAVVDTSARPFLQELAETLRREAARQDRTVHVIAESDLNDSRVIRPAGSGGLGFDAQWSDDYHHALHAVLTGERSGYYRDFGTLEHLARAVREGFVYSGQHSIYRNRRHGNSARDCDPWRFVVCTQNHDQVGNRALGDRLAADLSFEQQKLAACGLLLSPFLPLLFMGQEYGETVPFPYFTSHSDPNLAEAVRKGRRSEFAAFGWKAEEIPDPQDVATFASARLRWDRIREPRHEALWRLHRELLRLRRERPALRPSGLSDVDAKVEERGSAITIRSRAAGDETVAVLAFGEPGSVNRLSIPAGRWERLLDTEDAAWGGPGSALPEVIETADAAHFDFRASSCVLLGRHGGDGSG